MDAEGNITVPRGCASLLILARALLCVMLLCISIHVVCHVCLVPPASCVVRVLSLSEALLPPIFMPIAWEQQSEYVIRVFGGLSADESTTFVPWMVSDTHTSHNNNTTATPQHTTPQHQYTTHVDPRHSTRNTCVRCVCRRYVINPMQVLSNIWPGYSNLCMQRNMQR